jgi:hypothetical protein
VRFGGSGKEDAPWEEDPAGESYSKSVKEEEEGGEDIPVKWKVTKMSMRSSVVDPDLNLNPDGSEIICKLGSRSVINLGYGSKSSSLST